MGAGEMLIIGSSQLTVIGLIALVIFITKYKMKSVFYSFALKRVIGWLLIAVAFYFTSGNTLIDIYYRDYPTYKELLKKSFDDPENEELYLKLEKEAEKIR